MSAYLVLCFSSSLFIWDLWIGGWIWSLLIEDRYFGIPSFWLVILIERYLNLFFGVQTLFVFPLCAFSSRIGICGLKAELEFSLHWGERFGNPSFRSPLWWGLSFYFVCWTFTFPSCRCKELRSTPCLFLKKKVLKKQAFYVETFSFGNKKANLEVGQSILWFTVVQLCMQKCECLDLRRRKAIESVTLSIKTSSFIIFWVVSGTSRDLVSMVTFIPQRTHQEKEVAHHENGQGLKGEIIAVPSLDLKPFPPQLNGGHRNCLSTVDVQAEVIIFLPL